MTLANAMLVFRKDWIEIRRNWQILAPVIGVPLIISAVTPLVIILVPSLASLPGTTLQGLGVMIRNLPLQVRNEITGMTDLQTVVYVFVLYFLAPFFLIIPIMTSTVIASDSFAGEKERKTIEALLATPLTDSELFLGKILVSFVPSMLITVMSFVVYTILVDLAAFTLFGGRILLPNLLWIALIFGVTPTVALTGIGIIVLVSAKVRGTREAQQLSGVLIVPILLLVFGQIGGLFIFGPTLIVLLIAIFGVLDFVMFRAGIKLFRREEILPRTV